MTLVLEGQRIFVAGHGGMVGRALLRRLATVPCAVLTAGRDVLDLRRQEAVESWMRDARPDVVVLAAARVGGILANQASPVDYLVDNLLIETNVVRAAHEAGCRKLLLLGSSCIYPKHAPQPIEAAALLSGPLEPTNEMYAIAKIAGVKMCQAYRRQFGCDFVAAMPTNLYGPHDKFDLTSSHVLPALIRKAHEAKMAGDTALVIWGTGTPRREFLHVDDCADALICLIERYSGEEPVNVGFGSDIPIIELAELVCEIVGFEGRIERDLDKPDGTPAKLLDSTPLRELGWRPRIDLRAGIAETYRWYLAKLALSA